MRVICVFLPLPQFPLLVCNINTAHATITTPANPNIFFKRVAHLYRYIESVTLEELD